MKTLVLTLAGLMFLATCGNTALAVNSSGIESLGFVVSSVVTMALGLAALELYMSIAVRAHRDRQADAEHLPPCYRCGGRLIERKSKLQCVGCTRRRKWMAAVR
jgi:hypothetical protein